MPVTMTSSSVSSAALAMPLVIMPTAVIAQAPCTEHAARKPLRMRLVAMVPPDRFSSESPYVGACLHAKRMPGALELPHHYNRIYRCQFPVLGCSQTPVISRFQAMTPMELLDAATPLSSRRNRECY